MPLISARLPASVRAAIRPLLTHTYSRVVITPSETLDAWDNPLESAASETATTGLPCVYLASRRLRTTEAGSMMVDVSTLTVPHDDPIAVGDRVEDVTDRDGTVLVAAATVDSLDPTAEAGASVMKVLVLSGLRTVKS